MPNSSVARVFLGTNAVFSLLTSLIMLVIPDIIAQMMFVEPASWMPLLLRLSGGGLLAFALFLLTMAFNKYITSSALMIIVAMDIGWVIGSILLVYLAGGIFTSTGVLIVEIVAAFVALFAIGQYVGAGKITPPISQAATSMTGNQITATVVRSVKAQASTVWQVMIDHPGYADVASNLSKVEVLSGEGLGMIRRCFGPECESWEETCDLFEEGRAYGFKIHTDAADYPYPIAELSGRWAVETKGSGSEFSIEIKARPKGGFLVGKLFYLASKRQFKTVLIELAEGWATRMERRQIDK